MLVVETIAKIRRANFHQKKPIRQICRELKVSRKAVRKPGALRNGAPFKGWVLPSSLKRARRKLHGVPGGDRQMVDILSAALSDGLAAVEATCAEALSEGVHSADVIVNILARRRELGPATAIATPEALRLTQEPAADCARYDSLRRPDDGAIRDFRRHGQAQALRHEGRP